MNRTLLSIVMVLVSVGFAYGILLPKIQDVRNVSVEKSAKLKLVSDRDDRIKALTELNTTFASQQPRISTLISTLPQSPEVPELLVTVTAMAAQSNISIQSILPQINSKDREVDITLTGTSDLGAIERFMGAIADNNRPMSVTSFSLVKSQAANQLTYNFVLAVPYVQGAIKTGS